MRAKIISLLLGKLNYETLINCIEELIDINDHRSYNKDLQKSIRATIELRALDKLKEVVK